MTNTESWITLIEYSTKYNVSISTLRRKIKSDLIDYDMDNGKYYISDQDIKEALRHERNKKLGARRKINNNREQNVKDALKIQKTIAAPVNKQVEGVKKEIPEVKISDKKNASSNEAVLATANRLLDELKKAYTFVLQEKESQIIRLRSDLSDLKTLVRVLEDEVMKLRSK